MAARAKKVAPVQHSIAEMAEFIYKNGPDEIRESFTRADIELALDDRGWITTGRQWPQADLDAQTRTTLIGKSRLYWMKDPLAKQAVRLWTDYALGDGIAVNTDDAKALATINGFMNTRRNRRIMNSEGQRRSSKKLLVDGECFFIIFMEGKDKVIRRIDPLQITDIMTDPEDDDHVLGYRRLTNDNKVLYYFDWACDDDDKAMLASAKDPITKNPIDKGKLQTDAVVYHLPFDSMLKRGNGLLFPACDWSNEHRRFMQSRVAITQALAKFAWKGQVKGGQGVINSIKSQLESTYASSGLTGRERKPPTAPGGTWLQNSGIDLTPMQGARATGAGDAKEDGDQLKLMVCAATGIMLHYFGDPSTSNLAVADAMELPMLKMFKSYQKLWQDAYRDIFAIVLDEDPDAEQVVLDIDLPPIISDDLGKLGTFLTQMVAAFPEAKVPEVLQMCLVSLNMNNVDEVLKTIEKKRDEIDKQNALNPPANPTNPNLPSSGGINPGDPASIATMEALGEQTAAIEKLAGVMQESSRATVAPMQEAPPVNLYLTIDNKAGRITKVGKAVRNAAGEISFQMEEDSGT